MVRKASKTVLRYQSTLEGFKEACYAFWEALRRFCPRPLILPYRTTVREGTVWSCREDRGDGFYKNGFRSVSSE